MGLNALGESYDILLGFGITIVVEILKWEGQKPKSKHEFAILAKFFKHVLSLSISLLIYTCWFPSTIMSKSLSNGTLSLRFMQNALLRQNLQEIELKRAEIKDEGKWEVAQDIKDAWGKQPRYMSSPTSAHSHSDDCIVTL